MRWHGVFHVACTHWIFGIDGRSQPKSQATVEIIVEKKKAESSSLAKSAADSDRRFID